MRRSVPVIVAATIALLLTACASPVATGGDDARPSPTRTSLPTGSPVPTATALPVAEAEEGDVDGSVEPVTYIDADPSVYRTWIGTSPDNQSPHVVGPGGDHSQIDGVDFVTADGGIVCSMYSPYYPDEPGSSQSAIFCTAPDAPPACRAMSQSPSYGEPFPPNCGYGPAIDLTGASVQTLPAGSSLTWGGLVCIAWRVDAVNCTSNGYQFSGASANGFFYFG